MKRLTTLIAAMVICIGCFAGNPLKVLQGKQALKTVMTETATAVVQFDWSNTMYDNKVTAKEQFGEDYGFVVNDCQISFVNGFNGESKGLQLTNKAEGAKYKFVLSVTNLDCFFAAMRFVPRHESKMWGKLTIKNATNDEIVAEINIDEAEDGCDIVRRESFGKTFLLLGKKVAKLK